MKNLRRVHLLRRLLAFWLALAVAGLPGLGGAQTKPQTLYEAEAYLLYLFAMYTEWPKEAFTDERAPFVLGILGKDPFEKGIDFIKGKTVKGRNLVVTNFSSVQQVAGCHILFISSSEKDHVGEILKSLENSNILTVAEMDRFIEQSGMITIFVEKTRTGFGNLKYDVNQRAAEKAKLRINSYVLAKAGRT